MKTYQKKTGRPLVYEYSRDRLQLTIGEELIKKIQAVADKKRIDKNAACVAVLEMAHSRPDAVLKKVISARHVADSLSRKRKLTIQAEDKLLDQLDLGANQIGISRSSWFSIAAMVWIKRETEC